MKPVAGHRTRRAGLYIVAACYAVVTVLYALLWWIDLGGWVLLPFDLFAFWWPLPGFALLAAALVRGDRRAATLLLVPVLWWAWSHGGLFLPSPAAERGDLRVLSLNLWVDSESNEQLLRLLDEHDPDVVLLQEVFPSRMELVRRDVGDRYPHDHLFEAADVGGVAVLSKEPITDIAEVPRPHERARGTFVATIAGVQVVPVHLTSPCPACGNSLVDRLSGEDAARRLEMQAVLDTLDPGRPAIVGGDFNSTARGAPYRKLDAAGFRDPHRERGWGPGFTWSTRFPIELIRIDMVLVRGLEPTAASVGAAGTSDHRPVIIDARLPG